MLPPFPNAGKYVFKEKFIERYSQLTDWEAFKQASLSFLRRSIRANTLKISAVELKSRIEKNWSLQPIPWCKEGFWISHKKEERRDIGNLLEHHLGYFYVQDASSMIPPLVLQPKPGELVLDMCAAPGSKTTQMAAMMQNRGIIIANELSGERIKSLGINLQRSGILNVVVTNMTGYGFKTIQFDKILLDAPCTGTGTIMKSPRILNWWNPQAAKRLASQQKKLLETAFNNLKEGGELVYSTCTLEPEEDEGVINWLLEKYPSARLEEIKLPGLKHSPAVLQFEKETYSPEIKKCLRIWPQDNDTEGFFIAKIKKLPARIE